MLRFVCFALLVSIVSAIHFKDCGNNEVKSVDISGCTSDPCTLHKRVETTMKIKFTASEDSEAVELKLIAKIGELDLEVPGIDTIGCHFMKCPLKKGQEVDFEYKVVIPGTAPTIDADVTAKLTGDGGKLLACATLHGSLKE